MKTSHLCALLAAVGVSAACTQDIDRSPSVSVCDGLEAQRIALNSRAINGLAINGASFAGVAVEGRPSVGSSLRAVRADGTSVDVVVASESDGLFELTHDGTNVCADGSKGVFVPGTWDERGARHDSTLATFACASGAIAKCVLMGYEPARVGTALHQACTRMVRADYCGDGVSSTRDGTPIDVFDARGVQSSANEAGFVFEAGWNENGATCVNRPRITGAMPSCFRDLPTCASEEEAVVRGASLMNASRPMCQ